MHDPSTAQSPRSSLSREASLACGLLLAWGVFQFYFSGTISEIGGLGGDGVRHVVLAGRMPEAIVARDTTAYEWRHVLPYATVYGVFRLLGWDYDAVFGRDAIVRAHRVQNLICLLLACVIWARVLQRLDIQPPVRWLSFSLLLLNFTFTQMPFYHPCNGDSTQFLLGVSMLYCAVFNRVGLLLVLAVAALFVRPGADVYALCLLAFRPFGAAAPLDRTRTIPLLGSIGAGALAILTGLIALLYFRSVGQITTIQPPLGFVKLLSIPLMLLYVVGAFLPLLRDALPRDVLRHVRWIPLVLGLVALVAIRGVIAGIAKPQGDVTNELDILLSCVAYAVNKPAISPLAHMIYFGPAAILLLLLWPRVCRAVQERGLGFLAVFGVAALLSLHSESRLLTTPYPFFVLFLCVVLNARQPLPKGLVGLSVAAGAVLSKFWFSMGALVPWRRADYPDLLYWINQGPWIPTSMYLVQLVLMLLVVGLFAFALYRGPITAGLAAFGRTPSDLPAPSFEPSTSRASRLRDWIADRRRLALHGGVWLGVLLLGLVLVPRLFGERRAKSRSLIVQAVPAVTRTGATQVTASESRFGAPTPPGKLEFRWSLGASSSGGEAIFGSPRASSTRVRFTAPGVYSVSITVKYYDEPIALTESVEVYVRSLRPHPLPDFNADGIADQFWFNDRTGELAADVLEYGGDARTVSLLTEPSPVWRPRLVADFDADGTLDVLWRNDQTGVVVLHILHGVEITQKPELPPRPPPWRIFGAADVDGSGTADLIWVNDVTHEAIAYRLLGGSVLGTIVLSNARQGSWRPLTVGDFDGDGAGDLLWRNAESGRIELDHNRFPRPPDTTVLLEDAGWTPRAWADFNHDGRTDLVLRHSESGLVYVLYPDRPQNPARSADIQVRQVNPQCRFIGIGDFNGDGTPDLLWRDELTGDLVAYFMQESSRVLGAASLLARRFDLAWRVLSINDYNGDGQDDLLAIHDATGQTMTLLVSPDGLSLSRLPRAQRSRDWRLLAPLSDLRWVSFSEAPDSPPPAEHPRP